MCYTIFRLHPCILSALIGPPCPPPQQLLPCGQAPLVYGPCLIRSAASYTLAVQLWIHTISPWKYTIKTSSINPKLRFDSNGPVTINTKYTIRPQLWYFGFCIIDLCPPCFLAIIKEWDKTAESLKHRSIHFSFQTDNSAATTWRKLLSFKWKETESEPINN